MSRPRRDHPDMRHDAPGRIPESLIDAAMDGELDPQIQQEIGRALQYDPARRQEFHDTRDAINALRMPIDTPDLSDRVLARAHRHRRFIPCKLRQQVRAGRVVMAALLLTTMLGVAGLQRAFPRLTTLGAQPTPVANIESAVEQGGQQIAQTLSSDFHKVQECVAQPVRGLLAGSLDRPGTNNYSYELRVVTAPMSASPEIGDPLAALHPSYAIVSLASNASPARASRQRIGLAQRPESSGVLLASWVSAPQPPRASNPSEPIDKAIDLP